VYNWSFMGPVPQQEADELPHEGRLALQEFMTALSLNPWGFTDENGGTMPTTPFAQGRGLLTVVILDYRRELVITKVQWLG
jgi:hypothetical protein